MLTAAVRAQDAAVQIYSRMVGLLQGYTTDQLDLWQEVLDEENPELFKVLTRQLPQPERLTENPVFMQLQKWVDAKSLLEEGSH